MIHHIRPLSVHLSVFLSQQGEGGVEVPTPDPDHSPLQDYFSRPEYKINNQTLHPATGHLTFV